MTFVTPAVLPSSRDDLKEKLSLFASLPLVERIQIDVVDGVFARPASWPYKTPGDLEAMVEHGEMLPRPDRFSYEIDLMCLNAERAAGKWLSLGANRLTFHAEGVTDIGRLFASVRSRYGGPSVVALGIALDVASNLNMIETILHEVAYVQFMGISRIGRQGQPFDERVYEKVRIFRARHPHIPLQIDGGITHAVAKKCLALGVDHFVVGSGIVRASDPVKAITAFENLKTSYSA